MIDPAARAQRAKALLDDEVLKEAFAAIEADYVSAWKSCTALQAPEREALWAGQHALELLKSKLQAFVADGQILAANKK